MVKQVVQLIGTVVLLCASPAAHAFAGNGGPTRAAASFDAYYDGFYGPFYNGYWASSGDYFYSVGPGRPYARDDGSHFRRLGATGYVPVEGSGPQTAPVASARR